jgi:hypothetical protein
VFRTTSTSLLVGGGRCIGSMFDAQSANDRLVRAPLSLVLNRHTSCTQVLIDFVANETKTRPGEQLTLIGESVARRQDCLFQVTHWKKVDL